ncbi:hypothetical protein IFM89_017090 [Coptis chinensis]|uniref:Uncharacterized protein n=1 Tax=Coptis chinensis TaxID=261450 RepID=A0A835HDQ9_9MAGN|nr:hypothetical protein IFM89_017090 [Coptis chinensis]
MLECEVEKRPFACRFKLVLREEPTLIPLMQEWWESFSYGGRPSEVWWRKLKELKVSSRNKCNTNVCGRVDKKSVGKVDAIDKLDMEEDS